MGFEAKCSELMVQYQKNLKIKGGNYSYPIRSRNDLLGELMICGRTFLPTPTTLKGNTLDIFLYNKNPL